MATTKVQYGAAQTFTIDLGGLPHSAQFLVGRQSNIIDNGTDQYLDCLVYGYVRGHATLAASATGLMVQVFVFTQDNDTPTYPTYDGASRLGTVDAAVTFGNVDYRANACRMGGFAAWGATTANQIQNIAPFSVASLFGGVMPKRWGLFVAQDTGQALHVTSANHVLQYIPITLQSA